MVANVDTRKLKEKLDISFKQLKEAKNSDEKIVLANYIGNLSESISLVDDTKFELKKKRIFGSNRNHRKFLKKLDIYEDRMLDNFILNKEFHSNYMGEILSAIEDNIFELEDGELSPITILTESDFYTIFFDFMKSIKLDSLFEKFIKEGKIYATKKEIEKGNLGYTLYNPTTKDSDIFIDDFDYDIHTLTTLAHEFGHVYDLGKFDEDMSNYNRYFYQSFYSEVFSKVFEKLFLDYMFKNNILYGETQDKLFEMTVINHDYILGAYMLSLLPDKFIYANSYGRLSKDKFIKLIKDDFIDEENIREFVYNSTSFRLGDDFNYSYGAVISTFLKESIDECGFSNELVEAFFKVRSNILDEKFLREWGMGPEQFKKLNEKELQYLKK